MCVLKMTSFSELFSNINYKVKQFASVLYLDSLA